MSRITIQISNRKLNFTDILNINPNIEIQSEYCKEFQETLISIIGDIQREKLLIRKVNNVMVYV